MTKRCTNLILGSNKQILQKGKKAVTQQHSVRQTDNADPPPEVVHEAHCQDRSGSPELESYIPSKAAGPSTDVANREDLGAVATERPKTSTTGPLLPQGGAAHSETSTPRKGQRYSLNPGRILRRPRLHDLSILRISEPERATRGHHSLHCLVDRTVQDKKQFDDIRKSS
ncbi:hypothetical protein AVEN_184980-1 [Araneus ventricosus]|uniref:Uncharacterized protein n=1 Tax=Araneus ventricosus TaxID=182803 RepID=A0A4Y2N6T8_ARAVE|nr:hypothetical protein AVEN_184980-1 [Araneus ventricosus]